MYPNGFGYGAGQSMSQYQQPVYGQVQAPMMQPQQSYSTAGFNRQPQIQLINGRMISNPNEIVPGEVPMNGQMSFFPMADKSCVYAMIWEQDGNLKPYKYVLEQPEIADAASTEPGSNLANDILSRLDSIEQTIASSTIKPKYNSQRQNTPKKEEVDDA